MSRRESARRAETTSASLGGGEARGEIWTVRRIREGGDGQGEFPRKRRGPELLRLEYRGEAGAGLTSSFLRWAFFPTFLERLAVSATLLPLDPV